MFDRQAETTAMSDGSIRGEIHICCWADRTSRWLPPCRRPHLAIPDYSFPSNFYQTQLSMSYIFRKKIRFFEIRPRTNRSSSVMVAKYPKLYSNFKRIFSSNKVTSMLRTVFVTKSNSWFLRRHRRFATLVRTNWITLPRRRPTLASKRSFKSSNVSNLPFIRLHRYFSPRRPQS